MTRKEAERQTRQADTLRSLGFTQDEAEALRRISITLHRWFEHECNGAIQRDETTDRPYWYNTDTGRKIGVVPDLEKGAMQRLKAIVDARNDRVMLASSRVLLHPLTFYIQGDPRGAVLYIIRPGDVPEGADVGGYYSRGICVY